MLRFQEFLVESGNFAYQSKQVRDPNNGYHDGYHVHSFKDNNGDEFHVDIEHNKDDTDADVSFGKRTNTLKQKHHITGESGKDSQKIFSTVHNIIKQHALKHPSIKQFKFTSDKDEPTRTKLYHRYVEKHRGKTEPHPADDRGYLHTLPASSLKEDLMVESGNFSYDFSHRKPHPDEYHEYAFADHHGTKYVASIVHTKGDGVAHVQFDNDSVPVDKSMKIVGNAGTSSGKILSTVHHILKKHTSKHPEIDHYQFTSVEPSRAKLYSRYAQKHGGNTEANEDPDTKKVSTYSHYIPASSLRD